MNDSELLELAAKACGFTILWDELNYPWRSDNHGQIFDPLTDDGDALRLAVGLGISIYQNIIRVEVSTIDLTLGGVHIHESFFTQGTDAATRRAIVRSYK